MRKYRLIEKTEMTVYERLMLSCVTSHLASQTNEWHINSPKRVSCCVYLKSKDDYIVGQNIGISNVTGSLCAERAAISNALSKYPKLQFKEITDIMVIGEKNPLLPCGVCCEWLYKINPHMNIYTLKDDKLLKIDIFDYYGDETTVECL